MLGHLTMTTRSKLFDLCQAIMLSCGAMHLRSFVRPAVILWLCSVVAAQAAASGANTLVWNTNRNLVTADIRNGELRNVLEKIATVTGWRVFVEPGARHSVSAKFKDLPPGSALNFLLGDLSFAMIPGSNSSPRLLVFQTSAGSATELIPAAKAEFVKAGITNVIPNQLIVRVKPGTNIEDLARKLGAKVTGRLAGQNTYRLEFADGEATEAARTSLASNDQVESVDNNYVVQRPTTPEALQASNLPGAPKLTMKAPTENGRVIIGLIDTAVQSLGGGLDAFMLKQISVAGAAQLDPSNPSHGTSMAETMLRSLQIATDGSTSVQILPVDVYGSGSSSSTFDVASGIVEAVNAGARIVNLSLGSEGNSSVLQQVIQDATSKGVLVFAAAGNTPVTTPYYPAAYSGVLAVTATEGGELASYANRGSFVSLAAPGTSLVYYNNQSYYVVGTSAASAFTSGIAAGYMDSTQSSATKARDHVTSLFGVNSAGSSQSSGSSGSSSSSTRRL